MSTSVLLHEKRGDSTLFRFLPIFYRTLVRMANITYNDCGVMGIVYRDEGYSNDLRRAAHERAPPKT